ncbi:hypothetical protein GCM10009096_12840 [Parasphingorhabdus litoris]|uniref:Uncharacterized protein n=1 Tax=Parasphingorhabdus litoris TaxID=394733 RepID=A0ABN1ACE4_9SPHN
MKAASDPQGQGIGQWIAFPPKHLAAQLSAVVQRSDNRLDHAAGNRRAIGTAIFNLVGEGVVYLLLVRHIALSGMKP